MEIAARAGVNRGSVLFAIKSKENLLRTLVSYVLESTFSSSTLLVGETDNPVLSYAVESALQLYMAESREEVRELAAVAYTLPTPSDLIYRKTAKRLSELFKPYNPDWEEQDFYEREIASGSIMRAQLDEILALYRELTEDEQGQLDLSRVLTLQEALDGVNAPAPAAGRADRRGNRDPGSHRS